MREKKSRSPPLMNDSEKPENWRVKKFPPILFLAEE